MDKERVTANIRRISPQDNGFAIKKKICNVQSSSTISLGGMCCITICAVYFIYNNFRTIAVGDGQPLKKKLRSQDLVQLRKEIEKGDKDMVSFYSAAEFKLAKFQIIKILKVYT
jgi:hypothetical protein